MTKTAGMTKGTPDWQLDNLFEGECAEEWEKANEPEPKALDRFDYDSITRAWTALEGARIQYELLENRICDALQRIEGTPESDKLASIYDSLTNLRLETKEIRETLKKESHKALERRYA